MADDFSRDFQEVLTGYQGMHNTIGSLGVQTPPPMPPTFADMSVPPPMDTGPPPTPPPMPQMSQMPPLPAPPPPMYQQMPPPPPPMPPPVNAMHGSMGRGMDQASQHQIGNPSMAAFMDPGGMQYASPSMMTPSDMGVFRTAPVSDRRSTAPYSISGEAPPAPMFPLPLPFGATSSLGVDSMTRTRPELMFSRPFDAQIDRGSDHARLLQGGYQEYSQAGAESLVGMGGSLVGGAMGTVGGAFLGGPKGGIVGMEAGSLVGAFANHIPGVTEATGAAFQPAIERRADAIQTQFGSRQYLTGGDDLDITGSGLSTEASQGLMTDFDQIAGQQGLTRADVTQLTQLAGEQGLLDMSSNADQIGKTMKGITSLLGTMAEITGDPDFMNNIKKIGQLRRLGFDPNTVGTALRNMDSYSRMAGMDVDQMMQNEGQQGAAMFNSAGLLASQGMEAGFMGGGQAHLATQSGTFDEQTLALYGGQSGVAQQITSANAAFAAGPMAESLLPFFMQQGPDGLQVDTNSVKRAMSGDAGIKDMMREGTQKFHGDVDSVMEMQTNAKELLMRVTEDAGQEGMQLMMLRAGMDVAQEMNTDLRGGLQVLGLGEEQSNVLHRMAHNPEYWNDLQQQQQKELQRLQFEERQRQEDRTHQSQGVLGRGMRSIQGFSPLADAQNWVSDSLARHEENQRIEASGLQVFGAPSLEMTEERMALVGGDGYNMLQERLDGHHGNVADTWGSRAQGAIREGVGMSPGAGLIRDTHNRSWLGDTAREVVAGAERVGWRAADIASPTGLRNLDTALTGSYGRRERELESAQDTASMFRTYGRQSVEEQDGAMQRLTQQVGDAEEARDIAVAVSRDIESGMGGSRKSWGYAAAQTAGSMGGPLGMLAMDQVFTRGTKFLAERGGIGSDAYTDTYGVEEFRETLRDQGWDEDRIEKHIAADGHIDALTAAEQISTEGTQGAIQRMHRRVTGASDAYQGDSWEGGLEARNRELGIVAREVGFGGERSGSKWGRRAAGVAGLVTAPVTGIGAPLVGGAIYDAVTGGAADDPYEVGDWTDGDMRYLKAFESVEDDETAREAFATKLMLAGGDEEQKEQAQERLATLNQTEEGRRATRSAEESVRRMGQDARDAGFNNIQKIFDGGEYNDAMAAQQQAMGAKAGNQGYVEQMKGALEDVGLEMDVDGPVDAKAIAEYLVGLEGDEAELVDDLALRDAAERVVSGEEGSYEELHHMFSGMVDETGRRVMSGEVQSDNIREHEERMGLTNAMKAEFGEHWKNTAANTEETVKQLQKLNGEYVDDSADPGGGKADMGARLLRAVNPWTFLGV